MPGMFRPAKTLPVLLAPLWAAVICLPPATAAPAERKWTAMNYGPYLTASLEVRKGNIAHKGIAVRLDPGAGGVSRGSEFIVFDTDTLRYAGGWVGEGFCNWRSIVYDGSHGTHPAIVGRLIFQNPVAPGWGRPGDGSFADERQKGRDGARYGPLDPDWGRWNGLYLHGRKVVLSYRVGKTDILEVPGSENRGGLGALTRSLQIGPRARDLVLQVAEERDRALTFHAPERENAVAGAGESRIAVFRAAPVAQGVSASESKRPVRFDGATRLEAARSSDFNLMNDFSILARIRTRKDGTIFAKAPAAGRWAANGKSLFVRGGRLVYDIGWVGAVRSKRRVADGKWHDVALTYQGGSKEIRMYIDGELDSKHRMGPKAAVSGHVVRVGFTSPDFPEPSPFVGDIAAVRFYSHRLGDDEVAAAQEVGVTTGLVAHWNLEGAVGATVADRAVGGKHPARVITGRPTPSSTAGGTGVVAVVGAGKGTRWVAAGGGHLRLRIPAGPHPIRMKLLYARLDSDGKIDFDGFAALLESSAAPRDLTPLTQGGPARWSETVTTEVKPFGAQHGAFAAESLSAPLDNPYDSWMRLGGFDFFKDGRRAAVCTWMGDVWIVDGLTSSGSSGGPAGTDGQGGGKLIWRRFATGLYQALGLKITGDVVYALGRDQITRLHDLNGDGEADFYENFNNAAQATEHFHEFAMDLQTDSAGNFYYMKGGRHAKDSVVPQHGTLMKVTNDGRHAEILAYGFRAPNGLCVNSDGSFLSSDQEGHWIPMNRINWIKPGGFYGYMWSYHRGEKPETYDKPLCWIHKSFDRSPSAQFWVKSRRWGPLNGKLLAVSYGTGRLQIVLHEEVDGEMQGGVAQLPVVMFPTGVMRGRFHPGDGHLYLCGLYGWAGNRTLAGGFYRIRYTGREIAVPTELHAVNDGIVIRFSTEIDPRRAGDPRRYSLERWNYRWRQQYGSKDYKVSDGKVGRDRMTVSAVNVAKDAKGVYLKIAGMKPCMQMRIRYRLASKSGKRMAQEIYSTVHALGDATKHAEGF